MNEQRLLRIAPDSHVPYRLKLSAKRRTVAMQIDEHGLIVSAPLRLSHAMVENFLQKHAGWIVAKLQEFQSRQTPKIQWQDGEKLLLLGNEITLCLTRAQRSGKIEFAAGRLLLALPDIGNTELVARKVQQWYRAEALNDCPRRVELLATKLGLPMPQVYLSSAKTRWGSCNSKREVRLNWRLIQAPPPIIHYVAAHELAHLKEMNHSAKFWAWVEKLCPDYEAARRELKALSPQLHLV
ncbi:MAG: M48 family peptidase [Nitrosomonadales bacterium]|nr:MAG: M48 family peptidase [Nitrosomonadales bacterium]